MSGGKAAGDLIDGAIWDNEKKVSRNYRRGIKRNSDIKSRGGSPGNEKLKGWKLQSQDKGEKTVIAKKHRIRKIMK